MKRWFWILGLAWIALAAYRLSMVTSLGWASAWNEGWIVGHFFDLILVLACGLVGGMVGPWLPRTSRLLVASLLLLVTSSSLAQAIYYSFFRGKLFLWIALQHTGDVGALSSTIFQLLENPWILSGLFFNVAVAVGLVLQVLQSPQTAVSRWWSPAAVLGLLALIAIQQLPQNHRKKLQGLLGTSINVVETQSVVYDHPLISWMGDLGPQQTFGKARILRLQNKDIVSDATLRQRQFHAFQAGSWLGQERVSSGKTRSQVREQWRRQLGLASDRPPNIVLFFVESWRAYEFLHPELGPQIFPELWSLVNQKGIVLERTYSSAWTAAQTVRGIFSTLCSFQDNILGAAVMLSQPKLKMPCLQELLAGKGYSTQWLAAAPSHYHNQSIFEKAHGTRTILEAKDYLGDTPSSTLGLSDAEYWKGLQTFLPTQVGQSPFFLHSINLGTHAPWRVGQESVLPAALMRQLHGSEAAGFAASFRRWDQSVSPVLKSWLDDPKFENTVFVLLGDHGVDVDYPESWPMDSFQKTEARFRIGAVMLSSQGRHQKVSQLRLQLHLAPLLWALAQSESRWEMPPSFLGSLLGPSDESPQPWVYAEPRGRSSQGTTRTLCHGLEGQAGVECRVFAQGQDPLWDRGQSVLKTLWDPSWPREIYRFLESVFVVVGRDEVTKIVTN